MLERFQQFSFIISGINRHIQRLERTEMIKYGYKGSYAQYLVAIQRFKDGVTCTQLSEICDKDKAAVSRIIVEMENRDLVFRESDNERLYNAKIKLTDEGKKAARYVSERACSAVDAVGTTMTDDERTALYAALDIIFSKLDTLNKEGIPH